MGLPGRLLIIVMANLTALVLVPLIGLGSSESTSLRELVRNAIPALVYANVTSVPTVLGGPWVVERLARWRWPLALAVAATTLAFAAAGLLAAQVIVIWLGGAGFGHFWSDYLRMMRATVLLAVVFSVGVFSYASIRERLRLTEERLHETERAEERSRQLAVEARLRSLESRIHPHFLFNTLNSISALIPIDPPRAERMVGRLAALLRSSLETTTQSLIPLEQELSMVRDYLEIERARFGDTLRGGIDVPEELRDARVPPLSVQSLVENAVKHGLTPTRGAGEVCVTARAEDGLLRVAVSDTGGGFELSSIGAGHGLDSLVARLDALFGPHAHVTVSRRNDRCVVELVLPRS